MPRSTHVYELNLEDETEKKKKKKKIVGGEYNKEIQVRVHRRIQQKTRKINRKQISFIKPLARQRNLWPEPSDSDSRTGVPVPDY